MSRRYLHPPLIEALCEFQFTSERWDWTLPGLLYAEVRERFSHIKQMQAGDDESGLVGNIDRLQFQNPDETTLIQVGPNLLAIHQLAPYPRWAVFQALILEMLTCYQNLAHPTGFKQVTLRYLNRIEHSAPTFQLHDYLNFGPQLPAALPPQFSNVFLRVDLPYPTAEGKLVLSAGNLSEADNFSPDEEWEEALSCVLGMQGCLEKIRFAIDPEYDLFYFGGLGEA